MFTNRKLLRPLLCIGTPRQHLWHHTPHPTPHLMPMHRQILQASEAYRSS